MFQTETGRTGAIHGELRTSRFATLPELASVAGIHPDRVSPLAMRFFLAKGMYTPQQVDESLWAVPVISQEPAEQGSPKRVKLGTESEYSVAGDQENEHMKEWTEALKDPGTLEEIQAQLESCYRFLAHLKDLDPADALEHNVTGRRRGNLV